MAVATHLDFVAECTYYGVNDAFVYDETTTTDTPDDQHDIYPAAALFIDGARRRRLVASRFSRT